MSGPLAFLTAAERLRSVLDGPSSAVAGRPAVDPGTLAHPRAEYMAKAFRRRLMEWIADFEDALDPDHEVGARLVSFGNAVVFHLSDISYWNPELIRFDGEDDTGNKLQLVQHVSQISVLLLALPKRGQKAKRIGVRSPSVAEADMP